MIYQHMLYSLRDISTIPSVTTEIKSRSECDPYKENIEGTKKEFLPVIAAPMSCVLNESIWQKFWDNRISCVIPRTVSYDMRLELCKSVFCAFSLQESKKFLEMPKDEITRFVLVDMANGHMNEQIIMGKKLKDHFENIKLMGGNIANPQTYLEYNRFGWDFVRVGIGGGAGCLSSTMTSVHYPMASLLSDIYDARNRMGIENAKCKVIADGGIGSYSEVIKCLALGADYVMMGKVFAKAAINIEDLGTELDYYGMSSKRAQKEMGNQILKTSEGKSETIKKEYTLNGWSENMRDYLRSAMSYCDSRNLEEFRRKAECQVISPNSSVKINDK